MTDDWSVMSVSSMCTSPRTLGLKNHLCTYNLGKKPTLIQTYTQDIPFKIKFSGSLAFSNKLERKIST